MLCCAGAKAAIPALELRRLAEAEAMVARFSRENEWLSMQASLPLACMCLSAAYLCEFVAPKTNSAN